MMTPIAPIAPNDYDDDAIAADVITLYRRLMVVNLELIELVFICIDVENKQTCATYCTFIAPLETFNVFVFFPFHLV